MNLCVFLWVVIFVSAPVFAATDIEFILDLSGSMNKLHQGEKQIDTARKSMKTALEGVVPGTWLALRVYGHRVEQTNQAESCKDTELVIPFGEGNAPSIQSAVAQLAPKGYTPIAHSLQQSRNDFRLEREAKKTIILLSDGEETCGGDPVAVLKELKAQGFDVVVHVIGFNVDAQTRAQLEAIATAGDGKYFDAQNADELNQALKTATEAAAVLEKEKSTYGTAIRGGNSYETAVALPLGQEMKLDHHQKVRDFDYFYVDLNLGQQITLDLKTLEKGVRIREGQATENQNPYAGIELHSRERKKLKGEVIIGAPHANRSFSFTSQIKERFYILVGNSYEAQNQDHVTFMASVTTFGDLGSDQDAGDDFKSAMPLAPGRHEKNHLGGGDSKDTFLLNLKKGETYVFGVIPNDEINGYLKIRLTDDFKQQLLQQSSATYNSGIKTTPFAVPADGTYVLEVSVTGNLSSPKSYSLVLTLEL